MSTLPTTKKYSCPARQYACLFPAAIMANNAGIHIYSVTFYCLAAMHQHPIPQHESTEMAIIDQIQSIAMKRIVIGLYGVPGAGKTTLLRQLKRELGEDHFLWCEGSERLGKLVEGGWMHSRPPRVLRRRVCGQHASSRSDGSVGSSGGLAL